jgi:hypothetical protein
MPFISKIRHFLNKSDTILSCYFLVLFDIRYAIDTIFE